MMAENADADKSEQSFVDALLSKYKHSDDLELDPDIFIPKQPPGKADSSGNIVLHTEILALNNSGIANAGPVQDILDCLKGLKEVDLTCNNISDWHEVFKLIQPMPVLEFLNLTSNPLYNSVLQDLHKYKFPSIHRLVLNSTQVPWSSLIHIIQCFPNIEELHLSLNNYTSVAITDKSQAPSVSVLYFNGNNLTDFSEVAKLGYYCPNLKSLVMGESKYLQSFGEAEMCKQAFPNLTSLTVSDTAIEDWEQIDTLRQFPMLDQVRLQRIPLLEGYREKEGRQLLVGRLPNIVKLNGSAITETEREDAERAFIRHYMDIDEKPSRYVELESKYGKLDPLVNLSLKPKTTATVKIRLGDRVEERTINLRQTVKQFKKTLQDYAEVPVSKFKLYYYDHQLAFGADELRYPSRNLFALNIVDGAEFIIHLK